jgi:hypothetical protein
MNQIVDIRFHDINLDAVSDVLVELVHFVLELDDVVGIVVLSFLRLGVLVLDVV